jgi:hypothetical protein
MGTLASMSPEQAASGGIDVDTRSDVYSLGILLYELISGRPAFDSAELGRAGYSASLEILLHREVPVPSSAIAAWPPADAAALATCRSTDPARWISAVKGDLDQVVLKCLEKDRSRRYETVNGLAFDLARFLANEPVLARPASRLYRLRKFVDRNRAAFVSTLLITLTVLAGFAVSTGMYLRESAALKEQQRLRQIAETARAAEAGLRRQAQARANVSHASLLLSQGKTADADAVLRQTPLDTIEPSREATAVFRALGDWHLIHHRWKAAAECYQLLPFANRFIPIEAIPDTGDMIRTAPVLVMAGMDDAYEAHRKLLIDRFAGPASPHVAEQLVKMCLLKPAPPEIVESLQASADFLGSSSATASPRQSVFNHTALALYELRVGNPAGAIVCADQALALDEMHPFGSSGDFQGFLRAILTMACRQTGDTARAETEAAAVRQFVQTHGAAFNQPGVPDKMHFVPLLNRAFAMILAREALGAE